MRNGWGCALTGLTAKWEMFAKTGKTSSSVVVLQSGEIKSMNLRAGQTREFQTGPVEFLWKDSTATGFTGNKYYGYRIRFYYRGVEVKVVARPEPLAGWEAK